MLRWENGWCVYKSVFCRWIFKRVLSATIFAVAICKFGCEMNLMIFIRLMIQSSWDLAIICKQRPDWDNNLLFLFFADNENDNDDDNAITWIKAYEIVINSISIVRARFRFSSQFRTFVANSIVKQFVRFSWFTIIIKSVILFSCSFLSYLQLRSSASHVYNE